MATVGRGAEQYTVRFPDGLRDRIKAAADKNGRSMNAEIVSALEEAYPAGPTEFDLALLATMKDGVTRHTKWGQISVIIEASENGGATVRSADGQQLVSFT